MYPIVRKKERERERSLITKITTLLEKYSIQFRPYYLCPYDDGYLDNALGTGRPKSKYV